MSDIDAQNDGVAALTAAMDALSLGVQYAEGLGAEPGDVLALRGRALELAGQLSGMEAALKAAGLKCRQVAGEPAGPLLQLYEAALALQAAAQGVISRVTDMVAAAACGDSAEAQLPSASGSLAEREATDAVDSGIAAAVTASEEASGAAGTTLVPQAAMVAAAPGAAVGAASMAAAVASAAGTQEGPDAAEPSAATPAAGGAMGVQAEPAAAALAQTLGAEQQQEQCAQHESSYEEEELVLQLGDSTEYEEEPSAPACMQASLAAAPQAAPTASEQLEAVVAAAMEDAEPGFAEKFKAAPQLPAGLSLPLGEESFERVMSELEAAVFGSVAAPVARSAAAEQGLAAAKAAAAPPAPAHGAISQAGAPRTATGEPCPTAAKQDAAADEVQAAAPVVPLEPPVAAAQLRAGGRRTGVCAGYGGEVEPEEDREPREQKKLGGCGIVAAAKEVQSKTKKDIDSAAAAAAEAAAAAAAAKAGAGASGGGRRHGCMRSCE